MIETIDESLFISRFEDYKRVVTEENKNGNFTYKGLRALFQYLEENEQEDKPYELDVIGLCCEYSEYKDIEEFLNDRYTTEEINQKKAEFDNGLTFDEDGFNEAIEEEINNNTTLIKFEDDLNEGFIIQNY